MRRLLWLLLTATCFAQLQDNAPFAAGVIPDPYSGVTYQAFYPNPIAIGDIIVACTTYQEWTLPGNNRTGQAYAVTDSLGNTFTSTSLQTIGGGYDIYQAYSIATVGGGSDTIFAGVPSITAGDQRYSMSVAVIKNFPNASVDGATVFNTGTIGTTFTTTVTTAKNSDLLMHCGNGTSIRGGNYLGSNSLSLGPVTSQSFSIAGAAGSNTTTFNAIDAAMTDSMQTLAFKTASIWLGDSQLPDGGNTVAYHAQLHGYGGTGAYTYACTGLPTNGLSLNTSTGVISGTATTGTVSITCTVTDGTITSAAKNYVFTIGLTLGTPTFQQYAVGVLQALGSGASTKAAFSSPVACGDIIDVSFTSIDAHVAIGAAFPASTPQIFVYDSLGTQYHAVYPIGGSQDVPFPHFVGQVTKAGFNTVAMNFYGFSTSLNFLAKDISGAQVVVDTGTVTTNGSLGGGTPYTSAITTVVPNQLLVVDTSSNGGSDTHTYSPLSRTATTSSTWNTASFGTVLVASPSTYTATITDSNSTNPTTTIYALRPGIPGATTCASGNGEKFRRWSW